MKFDVRILNFVRANGSRRLNRLEPWILLLLDFLAVYVAEYFAAWGRASWATLSLTIDPNIAILIAAVINLSAFAVFQMYNSLWRYASISELLRILGATLVGAVLADLMLDLAFRGGFTLREYVLAWALVFLQTAGIRLAIRAVWGNQLWKFGVRRPPKLPRTLVVGAGQTGSLTIKRMLQGDEDMHGDPVALVDDDPEKLGRLVHGVKVWGTCSDIERVARECEADQIVLACPSATRAERQRLLDYCITTGLKVLTLPNVRDVPVDAIRRAAFQEVEVSELLAREEVHLDLGKMSYISGKTVLVTGGGGSIGSEIVRQLFPARPKCVVVFDVYENTAYELFHELAPVAVTDGIDLRVEIGSMTSEAAVASCFEKYHPDVVFHAAAHKHVPLMESNVREAVENNVFGTMRVARFASEFKCSHFILISTDKAVNPPNVMGATKRMCELEMQRLSLSSDTVFAAVRFGNVLGSHGSVIPLFRRQLKEGGPITVTHKDITRYFMTIPEAARLVITAGSLAKGGEIFILKMGEPVRIYDLAVNLVRLSGLKLHRDIEIELTGLRPGEKLFEELQMDDEVPLPTESHDIMVSRGVPLSEEELSERIGLLQMSLDRGDAEIKRALMAAVPTYHPQLIGA